jgi:hypothetical protein
MDLVRIRCPFFVLLLEIRVADDRAEVPRDERMSKLVSEREAPPHPRPLRVEHEPRKAICVGEPEYHGITFSAPRKELLVNLHAFGGERFDWDRRRQSSVTDNARSNTTRWS